MRVTLDQLQRWLSHPEGERLEFKAAREQYDLDELTRYCVALANARGGHLILGVDDRRNVVGSSAFRNVERLQRDLIQRIHLHVDVDELQHAAGRVLIVSVPSRPIGLPVQYRGAYWMRRGSSLVPMPPEVLRTVFDEAVPDFTADVCPHASLADLDHSAIERFRELWGKRSNIGALRNVTPSQLLQDAELLDASAGVSYAALILMGTSRGVARFLPQAETVFEYHASDATAPASQRMEFRQGCLAYLDPLWDAVNLRNTVQQLLIGFHRHEIPTFRESVVREAVLNAIAHRDYRLQGSTWVRQYASRLQVTSPGSFPPGVTKDNLLWRQAPRNRRLCDALLKCGLVERAGQGANRMFEDSISASKALPDYSGSDDYQVDVVFDGRVQDQDFVRFLVDVQATVKPLSTDQLLVLDVIRRDLVVPEHLKPALAPLVEAKVIARNGNGRGVRHSLGRRYRGGQPIWDDRQESKRIVFEHIRAAGENGCATRELLQTFNGLSDGQLRRYLNELRSAGQIHLAGRTRNARWHAGPAA